MTHEPKTLEAVLGTIAPPLQRLGIPFALVGGFAVSIRGQVRFTKDVDLAIVVSDDAGVERLVRELAAFGFSPGAIVEQEAVKRIATVRLRSRAGIIVDLLVASSGIEPEVVQRATVVRFGIGEIPVARAEELVAMKVLSMTSRRPQDNLDARTLLTTNPSLDLAVVRELLATIRARGFDRGEDLEAKLAALLADPE